MRKTIIAAVAASAITGAGAGSLIQLAAAQQTTPPGERPGMMENMPGEEMPGGRMGMPGMGREGMMRHGGWMHRMHAMMTMHGMHGGPFGPETFGLFYREA